MDSVISCLFAALPTLLGLAGAFHSVGYLHGASLRRLAVYWIFYLLTVASMIAVCFAPPGIGFLVAWELMGLFSAVLVDFDHRNPAARDAAWMYLLACEAGGLALMLLLSPAVRPVTQTLPAALLALFALLAFGLKIGFPGLHVWLPAAHPVAPAPISALLSGAMIPLGWLGLARFISHEAPPIGLYTALGWTLLVLGIVGALYGIASALPQKNLKRLLACSSVENMGIVGLATGLALLAPQDGDSLALRAGVILLIGAALHILNHGLLKGALFLAAGTVYRQTGTLNLEEMGGLLRRLPRTGRVFILAAAGLCGLPPFCCFVSELAIYCGAFRLVRAAPPAVAAAAVAAMLALALTGALAAAVFAKACAAAFLGTPRTAHAADAREAPAWMWLPPAALFALSCVLAPAAFTVFDITTANWIRLAALAAVPVTLVLLWTLWMRRKTVAAAPTWDCGYASPTPRMAYTGTAITQPLADFLGWAVRRDLALAFLWRPLFTRAAALFERAHALQSGYLHLYVLAMTLTVLALLAFAFV